MSFFGSGVGRMDQDMERDRSIMGSWSRVTTKPESIGERIPCPLNKGGGRDYAYANRMKRG